MPSGPRPAPLRLEGADAIHLIPDGGYVLGGLPAIGGGIGGVVTLAMRARSGAADSGTPNRDVLLSLSGDISQAGSAAGLGFQVGASTVWEAAFTRASWRNNFSQAPAHAFGHKYSGIYATDPAQTYWRSDRFMIAGFENLDGGRIRRESWAWLYGRDGRSAPMDLGRRSDIWTGGGTPPNDQLLVHTCLALGPFGHGTDATNTATHGILWAAAWGRRLREREERELRDFGPAALLRPVRPVPLRIRGAIPVFLRGAIAAMTGVAASAGRRRRLNGAIAARGLINAYPRRDRAVAGICAAQGGMTASAAITGSAVFPSTILSGCRRRDMALPGRRNGNVSLKAGRKG